MCLKRVLFYGLTVAIFLSLGLTSCSKEKNPLAVLNNSISGTMPDNIKSIGNSILNPVQPGLLVYVDFNETTGLIEHNLATGVINWGRIWGNITRVSGYEGHALYFHNIPNSFVWIGTQSNFPKEIEPFTIEVWIKPESMGNQTILGWKTLWGVNNQNELCLTSSGIKSIWSGVELIAVTGDLSGNWHHVICTYDPVPDLSGYTRKIYVDGNFVTGDAPVPLSYIGNRVSLIIGNSMEHNASFQGSIDEVAIWTRTLNQSEIQSHYNTSINNSAIGQFKMNEGSGTQLHDANGNPVGVIYGATWVSGVSGNALDFNGQDNYIDCGPNAAMNITGDITIQAWVKTTKDGYIVIRSEDTPPYRGYAFRIHNGVLGFWDGVVYSWGAGYTSIEDGNWHYLVVTGSGSVGKFYIDCNLDASFVYHPIQDNQNTSMFIGYDGPGVSYPYTAFTGSIDGLLIWNRVLSQAEIINLYNNP